VLVVSGDARNQFADDIIVVPLSTTINYESVAIIFIHSILRAKPHKALPVLQDSIHSALRESLLQFDVLKFDPASGILGEENCRRV
jgi:hypothetical protein